MPDIVGDNNNKSLVNKLISEALSKIVRSPESQKPIEIKRTGSGLSGIIKVRKHREPYLYGNHGKIHDKEEIKRQLFNL